MHTLEQTERVEQVGVEQIGIGGSSLLILRFS